jgi:hypothetical protein
MPDLRIEGKEESKMNLTDRIVHNFKATIIKNVTNSTTTNATDSTI